MKGVSRIKHRCGSVEMLLVIPLFFLLTTASVLLAEGLLRKTRMQKAGWAYAMSKAHGTRGKRAEKIADEAFGERNSISYSAGRDCLYAAAAFAGTGLDFPQVFRGAALADCASVERLSAREGFPQKVEATVPGGSFKNSGKLKRAIWFEAMHAAGFDYPLEMLAVPELAGVAGAVKIKDLGGAAARFVGDLGRISGGLPAGD